jgi:hypothetical protein
MIAWGFRALMGKYEEDGVQWWNLLNYS